MKDEFFTELNADLVLEFNRYVTQNPSFLESIPQGAEIVLQVKGDEAYNAWAERVGKANHEEGRPLVRVWIDQLLPTRLVNPRVG